MPDLAPILGLLGGAVGVADTIPYVRDTVHGSTRPHRGTWLIWGVLAIVACASQRADGASWSLVMTATQAVLTGLGLRRCVHNVKRRLHPARAIQRIVFRRVLSHPFHELVRLQLAEDAHTRHVWVAVIREYLVRSQESRVHGRAVARAQRRGRRGRRGDRGCYNLSYSRLRGQDR